MSAESRPLPDVDDPGQAEFWAAAAEGRLAMQACDTCGYVRWPPGPICPECLSSNATWKDLSGRGSIWSYAVYEHVYHPAFAGEIPYTVILVELDEGPRIISRIIAADEGRISVGTHVSARFEEVAPGIKLVYFARDETA